MKARDYRNHRHTICTTIAAVLAALLIAPATAHAASVNVYRFYNTDTGTHFYTASDAERDLVMARWPGVFQYEGAAYALDNASPAATQALHRFYDRSTGTHFYTASDAERDMVMARWPGVFQYEGAAYMVSASQSAGTAPVYRFYRNDTGTHFYTASDSERDSVMARYGSVYTYEGVAYWIPISATPAPAPAFSEQTAAQAILDQLIAAYPILQGTTVTFGDARGYQAICYYKTAHIVISPTHSASLQAILDHEVWHIIDYRDNGVIDWGENVPPN